MNNNRKTVIIAKAAFYIYIIGLGTILLSYIFNDRYSLFVINEIFIFIHFISILVSVMALILLKNYQEKNKTKLVLFALAPFLHFVLFFISLLIRFLNL